MKQSLCVRVGWDVWAKAKGSLYEFCRHKGNTCDYMRKSAVSPPD